VDPRIPDVTTILPTSPKPRRRWLQFSLQMMLVVMLVFGCGFGWLAHQFHQARAQQKAEMAIEELGGNVGYRPASGGMIRTAVAWLGKLFGEDLSLDVTGVYLGRTQVNDAELAHLQGMTQLGVLHLDDTQVSDAGMAHLRGLTQLEVLLLDDTQVSDAGLADLGGLTELRVLSLCNTQITDAGIAEVQKALPNCEIIR
jgi:predicted negative regulator of RcsB-dependent stress response